MDSNLEKYMELIKTFNPIYKLVSYKTKQELRERHIDDCITPLKHIRFIIDYLKERKSEANLPPEIEIADAGSGAGLPGIPLAICTQHIPDIKWTLIEPKNDRVNFLNHALAVLQLKNVSVLQKRIEEVKDKQFDIVVFRALSPLKPDFVKKIRGILKPSGYAAAYKGRRGTIIPEIKESGLTNYEIVPYFTAPEKKEMNLVLFGGQS